MLKDAYLQGSYSDVAYLEARYDAGLAWLWAPDTCGGRQLPGRNQGVLENTLSSAGCPDPRIANMMGYAAAGPVIIEHGSEAQKQRWLRSLFTGAEKWCQLFSEPAAGSDLGAIRTTARRQEGGWVVSGLKSWVSGAADADWGLLLSNTEDAGLTAFAVNMRAARVSVTPVRQMTGAYGFAEVAFDGVYIPDDQVVGGVSGGFRVLLTATSSERQVFLGRVGWDVPLLLEEWRALANEDRMSSLRQEIVKVWSADALQGVHRADGVRATSRSLRGSEAAMLGKVRQTRINQRVSELRMIVSGASGMLLGDGSYDAADGSITRQAEGPAASLLSGRGDTIAGGGTEVLLNMIAERILDLPGEKRTGAQGTKHQSLGSKL